MEIKSKRISSTETFEKALRESENSVHVLRLYVAGNTTSSQKAIINIRKVCEERLKGRYQLEVIDISQHPELARGEQIIATPTMVKYLPPPLRRIIGDFSKTERILVGLDLTKTNP